MATQTLSSIGIYNKTGAPNRDFTAYTKDETNALLDQLQLGVGTGDMTRSSYDPQNIGGDVFDRANHSGQQQASSIADFGFAVRGLSLAGLGAGSADPITEDDSIANALAKTKFQLASVIREYLICKPDAGLDITTKLNSQIQQINESGAKGGIIVIPADPRYTGDGGWDIPSATIIEGLGQSFSTNCASRIAMNAGSPHSYMFRIPGGRRNSSLKNIELNLANKPSAIGLSMLPGAGAVIYGTYLENVHFNSAAVGIKIDSVGGDFECILNSFKRCGFLNCGQAIYNNTINSGIEVENAYISMIGAQRAFHMRFVGNLHVKDSLVVGNFQPAGDFATNGGVLLETVGQFNNIVMDNVQMERIEFAYRNGYNHFGSKPIKWKDCTIQAKMLFTAHGALIDDNCTWVNFVGKPMIFDSGNSLGASSAANPQAWVEIQHQQKVELITYDYSTNPVTTVLNGVLTSFSNPYSRVIDYKGRINKQGALAPAGTTQEYNVSHGVANIQSGASQISIYNKLVDANSIVNAWMMTVNGSVSVKAVVCAASEIIVYLTGALTADAKIGFEVLRETPLG